MPTLDFKGKQFVYSHHLSVPFRELKVSADKSLPAKGASPSLDDNLIIHGDNLEALKALLPTHAGKVDCIFIDPPYNTGNEGWCYNDNVRSPLMQEWLKKSANPVDKEDLERHDKWLCMMWPRLQLLKELLSETGSIWITLDDNEVQRCKILMDELFGEENFITSCIWHKNYAPKSTARHFSEDHDYILVYAKDSETWVPNMLERSEASNKLERETAWYLDKAKAVYWWHRIAVHQREYSLQGWQKQKIYPDLLVCLEEPTSGDYRFSVLETKGEHLKGNDDTEYKRKLFELLTEHVKTAVDAGELTLEAAAGGMTFRMLMENDWKQEVAAEIGC